MKVGMKRIMYIPVTVYPHRVTGKDGVRQVTGHYVHVGSLYPGDAESADCEFQFVGVHKCMCFTLGRPEGISDVLKMADALPKITVGEGKKKMPVQWLGEVKCYKVGNGLKLYLPNKVWELPKKVYEKKLVTAAQLTRIPVRGGKAFVVLSVPVLSRAAISE